MFVNKFGCRAVTIAGAILSSICLLISVWAQSVFTLYFTIGIGTGKNTIFYFIIYRLLRINCFMSPIASCLNKFTVETVLKNYLLLQC